MIWFKKRPMGESKELPEKDKYTGKWFGLPPPECMHVVHLFRAPQHILHVLLGFVCINLGNVANSTHVNLTNLVSIGTYTSM